MQMLCCCTAHNLCIASWSGNAPHPPTDRPAVVRIEAGVQCGGHTVLLCRAVYKVHSERLYCSHKSLGRQPPLVWWHLCWRSAHCRTVSYVCGKQTEPMQQDRFIVGRLPPGLFTNTYAVLSSVMFCAVYTAAAVYALEHCGATN